MSLNKRADTESIHIRVRSATLAEIDAEAARRGCSRTALLLDAVRALTGIEWSDKRVFAEQPVGEKP